MNQVQDFLSRIEQLSPADWKSVEAIFAGNAYGARRIAAVEWTNELITIHRRQSQATQALSEADRAVRTAAGVKPLPLEWRQLAFVAGKTAAGLVVARELEDWQLSALYAPFSAVLKQPSGRLDQITVQRFCSTLERMKPEGRDDVLRQLGPEGMAAEGAMDAIVEANLDRDASAAYAAARGATVRAGAFADVHLVQGAAVAAVQALMARDRLYPEAFGLIYKPFASVIPPESLVGEPIKAASASKATTSGCILPMAVGVFLTLVPVIAALPR